MPAKHGKEAYKVFLKSAIATYIVLGFSLELSRSRQMNRLVVFITGTLTGIGHVTLWHSPKAMRAWQSPAAGMLLDGAVESLPFPALPSSN
jgi:hypothetical protein